MYIFSKIEIFVSNIRRGTILTNTSNVVIMIYIVYDILN